KFIQFRHLVHRKNASVHSGNEPEVQCFFGAHASSCRQLCRVNLTNHVSELSTWRQALGIALLAWPPGNGNAIRWSISDEAFSGRRDRLQRILMHRAAGNIEKWNDGIEKAYQRAH